MEVNFNSYQQETQGFDRLIKSLPWHEKQTLFKKMENVSETEAKNLSHLINEYKPILSLDTYETRKTIIIALKALKMGLISLNQMTTLHIIDAAVRDFVTHRTSFVSQQTVNKGKFYREIQVTPLGSDEISCEAKIFRYRQSVIPEELLSSKFPEKFSKTYLERFFNLNTLEWVRFCKKMEKAVDSEQQFLTFDVPEAGCPSLLINQIQKVLKMCHYIDVPQTSDEGIQFIKKMVVPSFSMFQAVLKVKAKTLGRRAVKLIPTYYLLEKQDYAETKEKVGIPFALYFPEANGSVRYELDNPRFKAKIDGWSHEGPFAALLHDFYHALRELMMTENIAKARYELARIARNHWRDTMNVNSTAISDILVDGELIHCYPPELDTIFEIRSSDTSQIFGDLFYDPTIKPNLCPLLKYDLLRNMACRKKFWKKEFNLGRSNLHDSEQRIYDECLLKTAWLNIKEAEAKYYISPSKSFCNSTPWDLIAAAEHGSETLKKFIAKGIDIDTEEDNTDRALLYAILRNHKEAVKLLLEHNSSPDKPFISNDTPLHIACQKGNFDAVQLLIEHGASLDIKNNNDQKPMDIAKANGHTDIVELLEKTKNVQLNKVLACFLAVYCFSKNV